jgi:hypothetical protein
MACGPEEASRLGATIRESPPCVIYDAVSEMSVEAIVCPRLPAEVDRAGAEAIVTGDRDLLDHVGLKPPAIDPRTTRKPLALID